MKILVGVPIRLTKVSYCIELFYQEMLKDYIYRLKRSNLSPQCVFFGHERYWLPSLTFTSSVLTIPHGGSILAPIHKSLLLKLKIMRDFHLVMHSVPTYT